MADLTTLEAVKTYLGIDGADTATDDVLKRLISSESARFISLSGNPIASATYTETRNGNGGYLFAPRYGPVISVTSVTVDGTAIPQQTSTVNGWALVENAIHLYGYSFTRGVGNVVVVYVAGYATVPADVDQAVVEMVAVKYTGRARIGIVSQGIPGESTQYQMRDSDAVVDVIRAYEREYIG